MSEFYAGLCMGICVGVLLVAAVLCVAETIWPTFPDEPKEQ